MRILAPIASPGKLVLNLARTDPLFPCERVTLPQIARRRDLCFGLVGDDWRAFPLYTYTHRLPM